MKDKLLAIWNYFTPQFHIAVIFFLVGFATAEIIRCL